PRAVNAAVPEEVSALVMRLLAEAPAARPSSARQVARQLGALAAPPAESLHLSRQGRRPAPPPGARRWGGAPRAAGRAAARRGWRCGRASRPETNRRRAARGRRRRRTARRR